MSFLTFLQSLINALSFPCNLKEPFHTPLLPCATIQNEQPLCAKEHGEEFTIQHVLEVPIEVAQGKVSLVFVSGLSLRYVSICSLPDQVFKWFFLLWGL